MVYDVIADALPTYTLWLVAIGGVLYSAGVIFHVWERLRFPERDLARFRAAGRRPATTPPCWT